MRAIGGSISVSLTPINIRRIVNRVPNKVHTIYGANVIIFEGIFGLYDQKVLDMMDLKVFVDTDTDICLARRSMNPTFAPMAGTVCFFFYMKLRLLTPLLPHPSSQARCGRARI